MFQTNESCPGLSNGIIWAGTANKYTKSIKPRADWWSRASTRTVPGFLAKSSVRNTVFVTVSPISYPQVEVPSSRSAIHAPEEPKATSESLN